MSRELVVYFSVYGTAKIVAEEIAKQTGADNVIPAPTEIDFGDEYIRGFLFDNILHSKNDGDIHFGLYIPESYDTF